VHDTEVVSSIRKVLVFGAHSDVGSCLLPRLAKAGWSIHGFTRNQRRTDENTGVTWVTSADFQETGFANGIKIPTVISLMPIWALPDYQQILDSIQATSLIAFSSSSIITKANSTSKRERRIANLLQRGEAWANDEFARDNRSALILRPTMIYGGRHNRNVNRLARLIGVFRFFLLAGDGAGQRQPVHAEDLAQLCLRCLQNHQPGVHTYLLAGGETLRYREMIERIFSSVGLTPRILTLPTFLMRGIVQVLRWLPNQNDVTLEMIERMEQDLCYDDREAINELGWHPRGFQP
jgi:nucleoside-diphosphate-sugar epimerase